MLPICYAGICLGLILLFETKWLLTVAQEVSSAVGYIYLLGFDVNTVSHLWAYWLIKIFCVSMLCFSEHT